MFGSVPGVWQSLCRIRSARPKSPTNGATAAQGSGPSSLWRAAQRLKLSRGFVWGALLTVGPSILFPATRVHITLLLTNISSRSEGFRYLRTGYLPGKPLNELEVITSRLNARHLF